MRTALLTAFILMFGSLCDSRVLSAQSPGLSVAVRMPQLVIVGDGPIPVEASITNHSIQLVLLPAVRGPAPFSGVTIHDTATGQYVKSRLEASGDLNVTGSRFAPTSSLLN